ncbi:pyruvate, phosphate dikinase [Candidatus Marinimicrobia bacterium]|nr:pyruvate, phosphate dikinase [Candidatus Neomarinimicrobiota bacterium]
MKKFIYLFGKNINEGDVSQVDILGGKGANLAEMSSLNIPVPPGFTITTPVCNTFLEKQSLNKTTKNNIFQSLKIVEKAMSKGLGDIKNPLLLSVRSGAKISMPGMMETVLNIGLTSRTIPALIKKTKNPRFVYDSYRRLIMMYSDVVMEKAEQKNHIQIRAKLENILEKYKKNRSISHDHDLTSNDLQYLITKFKAEIKKHFKVDFPDSCNEQLFGAIEAVFKSWNGKRAVQYRNIENIPHNWGTAVNVQAMVFGNLGDTSATGVAFTRNPSNGNSNIYGEWLKNAQGEDVVAGIRTPNPINESSKTIQTQNSQTLQQTWPNIYKKLIDIKKILEKHYKDMQDIEFTIESGILWMLQTRRGKRTGEAAIKIAVEMNDEKLITQKEVIDRIISKNLDEIMHPKVDPEDEKKNIPIESGLPASPGGASGQIVFTASDAEKWHKKNKQVLLVRHETSPEDVQGMHVSQGIITAKGGMTSHAALVARGWGKACIVGCSNLNIDLKHKTAKINNVTYKEGAWLTINSTEGFVYDKKLNLVQSDFLNNQYFLRLMSLTKKFKKLNIRTNADNPKDAALSKQLGAKGVGLCRTEHMFFDKKRIRSVQKMILSNSNQDKKNAVMELLPYQKKDFYKILKEVSPCPVTIRLLDPPLHEFLPSQKNTELIDLLAQQMKVSSKEIKNRIIDLFEINPMLGHRGCRLAISFPEITEMQVEAIFKASYQLINEGIKPNPEIMIPLVSTIGEFQNQKSIIEKIANKLNKKFKIKLKYKIGTMIELPRACLTADQIAEKADFFSFGTNDLTQTTFGFSRDDIGSFIQDYFDNNILREDPFKTIDQEGVGQLVKIAVKKARQSKPKIKIGICGEHGGDPKSIYFFNDINLDYISCSPYRIPIAYLAAAKASIRT